MWPVKGCVLGIWRFGQIRPTCIGFGDTSNFTLGDIPGKWVPSKLRLFSRIWRWRRRSQNQALQALLFLYRQVLDVDLPWLAKVTRASKPKRLPVVLTRKEVRAVLAELDGIPWPIASLRYGGGLRLTEALSLRVNDLQLDCGEIAVRGGKGGKDRVTVLPSALIAPLRTHLSKQNARFERRRRGGPGVSLRLAVLHKYPSRARQWGWQYVFPADSLCVDRYSGGAIRHHVRECVIQRAVPIAVRKAGIVRPATCHTFRDPLAPNGLRYPNGAGITGSC